MLGSGLDFNVKVIVRGECCDHERARSVGVLPEKLGIMGKLADNPADRVVE